MNSELGSDKDSYLEGVGYVNIVCEVDGYPHLVVVDTGDDVRVVNRYAVTKKEETYRYKQAVEEKERLENIVKQAREDFDNIVEDVIESAVSKVKTRLLLNTLLGDSSSGAKQLAMAVITALEDIIKKEAPNKVKKETDDF